MLYSDQKYPFEKAKADPGLTEGFHSVNRYLANHGRRKITGNEAGRILMTERTIRKQVQDIDRDYEPQENLTPQPTPAPVVPQQPQKTQAELENELAQLRKAIQEKEAEIKNTAIRKVSAPISPQPSNDAIIERNLKDTGYSDKIN